MIEGDAKLVPAQSARRVRSGPAERRASGESGAPIRTCRASRPELAI